MSNPTNDPSVTQRLDEIKQNDEAATTALWEQYYPALSGFAEKRLAALGVQKRAFNGEDVAASALASFFKAVQRDRFTELNNADDLFRLLKRITIRKVIDRKRHSQSLKAGRGNLRGESAFGTNADSVCARVLRLAAM